MAALSRLPRLDPPVRALGTSRDPQDDNEARGIIDQVDHTQIANAQTPELRARQLHGARWARIHRQSEDRAAQSGGIARWKASELSLGGGRELDSVASLAHASSGP